MSLWTSSVVLAWCREWLWVVQLPLSHGVIFLGTFRLPGHGIDDACPGACHKLRTRLAPVSYASNLCARCVLFLL